MGDYGELDTQTACGIWATCLSIKKHWGYQNDPVADEVREELTVLFTSLAVPSMDNWMYFMQKQSRLLASKGSNATAMAVMFDFGVLRPVTQARSRMDAALKLNNDDSKSAARLQDAYADFYLAYLNTLVFSKSIIAETGTTVDEIKQDPHIKSWKYYDEQYSKKFQEIIARPKYAVLRRKVESMFMAHDTLSRSTVGG